jgi:hypothetical protein
MHCLIDRSEIQTYLHRTVHLQDCLPKFWRTVVCREVQGTSECVCVCVYVVFHTRDYFGLRQSPQLQLQHNSHFVALFSSLM